jgi:DNA polymerase-3 subunit delta
MSPAPSLYLFYGLDDSAIDEAIHTLQSKLGDASAVEMNSAQFKAPSLNLDEIRTAAFAMPFLAERRLVVVEGAAKVFSAAGMRDQFKGLLEEIPASTAFVIAEKSDLSEKNWLFKWMKAAGEGAFVKAFQLPEGGAMLAYLQKKTKQLGGEIEVPAAAALADLLGSDTRAAVHELEKLLAYVNYARPISAKDVEDCALEIGEHGDYFGLMDALSAGPGPRAITLLRKLQAERDPIGLYFGLVSQFRVLLQAREIVDAGGGKKEIAEKLKMHPYRAQKLATQCLRFDMATLESIYPKLYSYDQQIKLGQIKPELAMDFLVSAISV